MVKVDSKVEFDRELQKYEKKFIDTYVNAGYIKDRSKLQSHIIAYLILHQKLTRKEIQYLSNIFYEKNGKKGISHGAIANYLNLWESYGVLNKEKDKQQPNSYKYALKRYNQVLSSFSEVVKQQNEKLLPSFKWIQEKLKNVDGTKKNSNFHTSLEKIIQFLYHYLILVDVKFKDKSKPINPIIIFPNILGEFIGIEENELKKEDLEKIAILLLMTHSSFIYIKKDYLKIYCHLTIKGILSQKQLKIETDLSSGQISEGLNHLINRNMIKIVIEKGVRGNFYQAGDLYKVLKVMNRNVLLKMKEISSNFNSIYQDLIKNEKKLNKLFAYKILKEQLKNFSDSIEIFENLLKKMEFEEE